MDEKNNLIFDSQEENTAENGSVESGSVHPSHTHSGSRHGSHHHSHSHSSRKRRKSTKIKKFIKRNKYKIANAVIAVLFVGVLIVLGVLLDGSKNLGGDNSPDKSSGNNITEDAIQIEAPLFDEEDMMKDYQFSSLCHGKLWGLNEMNEFIGRLKSYDGDTIQKKAEDYLLSTGVTEAEITAIREIYLEG